METTTATEVRNAHLAHAARLARIASDALSEVEYLLKLANYEDELSDKDNTLRQVTFEAKNSTNEIYNSLWNFRL